MNIELNMIIVKLSWLRNNIEPNTTYQIIDGNGYPSTHPGGVFISWIINFGIYNDIEKAFILRTLNSLYKSIGIKYNDSQR